ncbi:hypothetical protein ES705_14470 [subsurface metagenome]
MWDCREINELEDNGFTPQLPIIKSTIHKFYSEEREIVYSNFLLEFILILILGGLLTFVSAVLIKKFSLKKLNVVNDEVSQANNINSELEKENLEIKKKLVRRFVIINGILLGLFIFWAFNYYNQILFSILYSAFTKSFFLSEGTTYTLTWILISIISMVILWIILQRLIFKRINQREKLISTIALTCSILIFIVGAFYSTTLSSELSLYFFLTLQIMMILGILFSVTFIYGFPHQIFSDLKKDKKIELIFKIIFEIIALVAILLIGLSYFLKEYSKGPLLLCGIILILLTPSIFKYFKKLPRELNNNNDMESESLKKKLKPTKMKLIEALLCIFALSYYLGVLRYYDNHTLINFNLILLPNFFIPIGFSLLIAIPMLLGIFVIIQSKSPSIITKFDLDNYSKNEIIIYLFKITAYFSLIILVACWWFSDIAFEIALVIGGIPLLMIFIIYLFGNINSEEIFHKRSSWKRLTIYLVIALTLAFSANGIMVSLLYVLTFLSVVDGQIVVRTAFEEELGFDAIQFIYDIQLLIAVIPIIVCLILIKILGHKIRK